MIVTKVYPVSGRDATSFCRHRLRLFKNPDFTSDHLMRLHSVPAKHKKNVERQAAEIRHCLVQAEEYLASSAVASMATKPVLLYYALMSLAIAEILVKGTGNCRLAKLRESHAAHGLSLVVDGSVTTQAKTSAILQNARAVPQFRSVGHPYGTFEVWRELVRECPVPGRLTETHAASASSSSVSVLFAGADVPPDQSPKSGYTLLHAVRGLPRMAEVLRSIELEPAHVRTKITAKIAAATGDGAIEIIVHPATAEALAAFYERITLSADAVNALGVRELPSGLILTMPMVANRLNTYMSLPPSVAYDGKTVFFLTNDWTLGEFGSFYVALSICGNLARYYPDVWMTHVERSTGFALLVQELCDLAFARLPILCAGELDRCYYLDDD